MYAIVKDGSITGTGTLKQLFPTTSFAGGVANSEFKKAETVEYVVNGEQKDRTYYYVIQGDIVLVDGGSGYEKAPRCVISRGYDVIRKNDTFESSVEIVINGLAGANIAGATSEDFLWKNEVLNHEVSLVSPMISLMVTLHRWHMPVRNTTFQSYEQFITKIITPQPPEPKTISSGSSASRLEIRPDGKR